MLERKPDAGRLAELRHDSVNRSIRVKLRSLLEPIAQSEDDWVTALRMLRGCAQSVLPMPCHAMPYCSTVLAIDWSLLIAMAGPSVPLSSHSPWRLFFFCCLRSSTLFPCPLCPLSPPSLSALPPSASARPAHITRRPTPCLPACPPAALASPRAPLPCACAC